MIWLYITNNWLLEYDLITDSLKSGFFGVFSSIPLPYRRVLNLQAVQSDVLGDYGHFAQLDNWTPGPKGQSNHQKWWLNMVEYC